MRKKRRAIVLLLLPIIFAMTLVGCLFSWTDDRKQTPRKLETKESIQVGVMLPQAQEQEIMQ